MMSDDVAGHVGEPSKLGVGSVHEVPEASFSLTMESCVRDVDFTANENCLPTAKAHKPF